MAKNHRYDGTITCFRGAITDLKNHGRTVWDSDLYIEDLELAIEAMENASTLTLDDLIPHGHWVWKHRHRGGLRQRTGVDSMGETHTITVDERYEVDDPYCSECGKLNESAFLSYCPNCGAMMDLKEGEDF